VEREIYCGRVAERCSVSRQAVQDEVERLRKRRLAAARKKQEKEQARPVRNAAPASRDIRYDDPRSAAAEEGVVRLLILDPGLFARGCPLEKEAFSSPLLGRFYEELLTRAKSGQDLSPASLSACFSGEEISHLTTILERPEDLRNSRRALDDYIEIIRTQRAKAGSAEDLRAAAEKYKRKKGYGV